MKLLFGAIAVVVAIGGFINFFFGIEASTPIPIIVSHPLAMLAMGYLLFQFIFPRLLYGTISPQYSELINRLQQTGSQQAAATCGGSIGLLHFRGPLLHVRVFHGGFLIKPFLMPAVPVFREEITHIQPRQQLLSHTIEIVHSSKLLSTPIRLSTSIDSPVGRALSQIIAPGLP